MRVPDIPASKPPELQPEKPIPPSGRKSLLLAYVLHLMGGGGFLGFPRFYLGYYRTAQLQLGLGLTTLLLPLLIQSNDFQYYLIPPVLVWYIADLFLLPGMTRAANARIAQASQP